MEIYLDLALLLCTNIYLFSAQTCNGPFSLKPDHLNKKMLNNTFWQQVVPGHHDCVRICMSYPACKSINFNPRGNMCELNTKNSSSVTSGNFQTIPGAIFTDIAIWPKAMASGCANNSCSDSQRCLVTGPSSYECRDIVCEVPVSVSYGLVSSGESTVGANRTYRFLCPFGQYAPGNRAIQCQLSGLWTSLEAKCIPGPTTCKELKICRSSYQDGHYWLFPAGLNNTRVKMYCANMTTSDPKEYITINERTNFAYDAGRKYAISEVNGYTTWGYDPASNITFRKIRINPLTMSIVQTDTTFAISSLGNFAVYYTSSRSYGMAASCVESYGNFKIDTTGTGVLIDKSIVWGPNSISSTVTVVQGFNRSGSIIYASCGGCGYCSPTSPLVLRRNPNEDVSVDGLTITKCV